MAGGRPPKSDRQRYTELEELASWFRQAVTDAGYESLNAAVRAEIAHKNVIYGVCGATRMVRPEVVGSLAVALGREPSEVMPVWVRAKEAMDRSVSAAKEELIPHLTTWAELPLPSLAVRNLLEAQAKAVERLPYDRLGVTEPPLSAVYVRQRIRASGPAGDGSSRKAMLSEEASGSPAPMTAARHQDSRRAESQLPVPTVLGRHQHLLITGEPGSGKSTLSSHLAWLLSRIWLREETSLEAPVDEPLLPVRIAARTLLGEPDSWSAVLVQAARRTLGHSLIADPEPGLFRGRTQGARWLVMVDGLDEVADRESRAEVIRMLALHMRTEGNYRLVLTSRPLPEAELAPLRGPHTGEYTMEPFGPKELKDFAGKWFAAQYEDEPSARAAAERFLEDVGDGRLKELVRSPLLATIAAVNATIDPTNQLPTSRLSLYQRFFGHLLGRRGAGRADIRQRYTAEPERLAMHLWLDGEKRRLLGALGVRRVEGEESLLDAALAWVRENGREHLALESWQTEVAEFLQGTGLLVQEQHDYRFLHHSFAEFFAARAYGERISPAFTDLEHWILRSFNEEKQTLAMFVLCLWADREECEADRIADRLLTGAAGGHQRVLLAALLLAEGAGFGAANRQRLVDRLESIGCCAREVDDQEKAFTALGALGTEHGVLDMLEGLARNEFLDGGRRLLAVEAFSRCGGAALTQELLGSVLDGVAGWLGKAARVAVGLGAEARELVRRRAWQLAAEPGVTSWILSCASQALEQMEMREDAEQLARRVLKDPSAGSPALSRATEAWLSAMPDAAQEVADIALSWPSTDSWSHTAVGKALEKAGQVEAASRIALVLLRSGGSGDAAEWAASLWARTQGHEGRPDLEGAIERSSADAGHYLWIPASLHRALADIDDVLSPGEWAREVQGDRWGVYGAGWAVKTWLEVEGLPAVENVMKCVQRGRSLTPTDRAVVAKALLDCGAVADAAELAELALRTPFCARSGYEEATRVLLKARGGVEASRLLEIWDGTPSLADNTDWLQGVLEVLPQEESHLALTCELARRLVDQPAGDADDVLCGLRVLLALEGTEAAPFVVAKAHSHQWVKWNQLCDIAMELAAMGCREHALDLWKRALGLPRPPLASELRLLIDVQAARMDREVAVHMEELVDAPETSGARRLRLRQLLAWLRAAAPVPQEKHVPLPRSSSSGAVGLTARRAGEAG
ncbi:NACHT domain-containing protein [Streptomyces sp. NPDC001770]